VGKPISASLVLSNNILVVCSQLLSVEGTLFLQWKLKCLWWAMVC